VAAWEPALASAGAIIWSAREEWARRMAPDFASLCESIGEEEHVTISYSARSDFPEDPETELRETLERRRQLHLARGATLDGPHRDDLTLRLGGRDLRGYGSAGQQRTAAIALRLLEATTLRRAHEREPVVLLDDPFAELDARRSGRILDLLSEGARGRSQTLLAVPRDGDVPSRLTLLERHRVRGGTVQRA
jgi:DNA replication and repair protein RecF